MEASKSLAKIQQEISSAKETTKVLKENNVQVQGEIKELRRKVSHQNYTIFSVECAAVTGVLIR